MSSIRLIVTDLDGTLVGPRDEHEAVLRFTRRMQQFQAEEQVVWAILTGRSLKSFRRVFRHLSAAGATPNYLISHHAFIYSPHGRYYRPHCLWNIAIAAHIWSQKRRSARLLTECHRNILSRFPGARTTGKHRARLCVRFRDSAACESAGDLARGIIGPHADLQILDYATDLDIRAIPATKGLAAAELSRQLNVSPDDTLAIGNGLNDMSILCGTVASKVACPANAVPEVMQCVHDKGGHIASSPTVAGTLESIEAFRDHTVNNSLPNDWEERWHARRHRGTSSASNHERHQSLHALVRSAALAIAAIITVLTVLAWFRLLGPLSPILAKPLEMLIAMLARITT